MNDYPVMTPDNTEFILVSFEGSDPYSQAGGLGVRVTELSRALAEAGFHTHLTFVGDPARPGVEPDPQLPLTRHRWCQWISKYYPEGVYQGEREKLYDFNETLPSYIVDKLVRSSIRKGRVPVVMGEDWHTGETICRISDLLHWNGIRDRCLLTWNANNPMGFEHVNWGRLAFIADITAVSHYMKHRMWGYGVNPIVIHNGIPSRLLTPPPAAQARRIREILDAGTLLFKIGRFDPDKRWLMAVNAAADLKAMGLRPKFILRGGIEAHGNEVMHMARSRGLQTVNVVPETPTFEGLCAALDQHRDADVFNLRFFVPEEVVHTLYAAADAVLANSGMEPFGLVGLEAMAMGAVVFTGSTGEEYADAFKNAIVLESEDHREITAYLNRLKDTPEKTEAMRKAARATAAAFTWDNIIDQLIHRLEFMAVRSNTDWTHTAPGRELRKAKISRHDAMEEMKVAQMSSAASRWTDGTSEGGTW